MGALPKSRISRARRGNRRSQDRLRMVSLTDCPRCGEKKRTHFVCPNCGTYNGISVIEPRSRAES